MQRSGSPSAPAAGGGSGSRCPQSEAPGPHEAPRAPEPAAQVLHDLAVLRLPELRALRRDAQRHEADLSYVRRLLQGRIDILRAELARRGGTGRAGAWARGGAGASGTGSGPPDGAADAGRPGLADTPAPDSEASPSVVDRLAEILTDQPARNRSSARHVTLGTPYSEEYRQLAADMLAEVALSDLVARTDLELHSAMSRLVQYEQEVSRRRRQFQRSTDDCSAEIARRYRDGEAQVDDLLA
ncbi:RsiG family protein [Streptomyces sp. NPDC002577]